MKLENLVDQEIYKQLTTTNGRALIPRRLDNMRLPKWALYLSPPHGKYIYDGTKKLIIKSRLFKKHVGEPLLLLSGTFAFGIITLRKPFEIKTNEEFKRYRKESLITERERKRWWNLKLPLYGYYFNFQAYSKPLRYKRIKGLQVFVETNKVRFLKKAPAVVSLYLSNELPFSILDKELEEIDSDAFEKSNQNELLYLHHKIHQLWNDPERQEKASSLDETLINLHVLAVDEILSRDLEHKDSALEL